MSDAVQVAKFGLCIVRPNGVVILKNFGFQMAKGAAADESERQRLAHRAALQAVIRTLNAALSKTETGN